LFYEVSYRLGFHPWEDLAAHPPFADQLLSLVGPRGARRRAAVRTSTGPRLRKRGLGVEEAFPAWEITDAIIADSDPDPPARALRFDELFYRLRRR
jgi:hypothetical protein